MHVRCMNIELTVYDRELPNTLYNNLILPCNTHTHTRTNTDTYIYSYIQLILKIMELTVPYNNKLKRNNLF